MSLKESLFREMNAHVRACDNKTLVVNAGYVSTLLVAFYGKEGETLVRQILTTAEFSTQSVKVFELLIAIILGYAVLFVQLWYRAWKWHYLNILHKMAREDADEFGRQLPAWMKRESSMMSFDNLLRMLPFVFNVLIIIKLSVLLEFASSNRYVIFIFLLISHVVISYWLIRFVRNLDELSA